MKQSSKLKKPYLETGSSCRDSLGEILSMIDLRGKKVLDIGSGDGYKILAYKKYTKKVYALDFVPRNIDNFVLGDAMDLPFKNECFDTVIMSEVLEHLPDMQKAIDESRRVLKKDGDFMLTTRNYFNIEGIFKYFYDKIKYHGKEKWSGHGVEELEHFLTHFRVKRMLKAFSCVKSKNKGLCGGIRPLYHVPLYFLVKVLDILLSKFLSLFEMLTKFIFIGENSYFKAKK